MVGSDWDVGFATLYFPDGSKYSGSWKEGKYEGYGVYESKTKATQHQLIANTCASGLPLIL
jgi:hypothetical protein